LIVELVSSTLIEFFLLTKKELLRLLHKIPSYAYAKRKMDEILSQYGNTRVSYHFKERIRSFTRQKITVKLKGTFRIS